MNIDFTALECFTTYLAGELPLEQVLSHPAYQAISAHARRCGEQVGLAEVERALRGQDSPFYGVKNLAANLERVRALEGVLRAQRGEWQAAAEQEIRQVLPHEDLDGITVYPLIGYDMGIGLLDRVCMNLNVERYLQEPREFLYYMIHETMHALYERHHTIEPAPLMTTPAQQEAYFALWVHSEGFAVYAPLRLRVQNGDLQDPDYRVLMDPPALRDSITVYHEVRRALRSAEALPLEAYMERIYGSHRVTYRAGGEIVRRIAQRLGLQKVQDAFLMDGLAFLDSFEDLLEEG